MIEHRHRGALYVVKSCEDMLSVSSKRISERPRLTSNLMLIACLPVKRAVELSDPEKKTLQQLSRKYPHQGFQPVG
ncbi:hypothetical protein [Pararobbsia alpina]|nr:hypothetical protein [Pararobbsia alpina]